MTAPRGWLEDLEHALVDAHGAELGGELLRRYAEAFTPGHHDRPVEEAVGDIHALESLFADEARGSRSTTAPAPDGLQLQTRLCGLGGPRLLSDLVPVFAGFGLAVSEQRRHHIRPLGRPTGWVDEFRLIATDRADAAATTNFDDALEAVWRGEAESDAFNALVLEAGLSWRQVTVLRACARYLRQAGSTFSQTYLAKALTANAAVTRLLVELFETRLDPTRFSGDPQARLDASARIVVSVETALEGVDHSDQDRILRSFLALVRAVVRTSFYRTHPTTGSPSPYLALKLDPAQLSELPEPRPWSEIWVYSPRVEGVHLRFGAVARGGLRWSDRREDFRTEVLGLVKAQMVKNAVIVPVGAKGGFVCKQLPDPSDREAWTAEGVACYQVFISALLDVTDNLDAGQVVSPAEVVRHDGDDPYLVVAADKGTATFSDIANELSRSYGFWLGDAFASGGSAGYDHKDMGITARGAWESVKRHFREMGIDCQEQDVTVVGVGDMSGDVFGNGMLLSEHLCLVAAFDHRHIFLDPAPDAATSYVERRRLFQLPRSSWADYDRDLISRGGGVFPRTAKSIPLSPEVRAALGWDGDATRTTPAELMRAILRAPVDLLWNGGIGTYVKASTENNRDVGDKANDPIRVDGADLRCRVVAEGGNLGLTQLGRIEYAVGGGRINTDAIDNSGGVDCSDREVNLKVLLNQVVAEGELTEPQRNELVAALTDEVAALVLRDNYRQNLQLSTAETHAAESLDRHATLIRFLEREGYLDRRQEALPDEEGIAALQSAGVGLSRPELGVLIAHSKNSLRDDLDASEVPDDPHLLHELVAYFPGTIGERFPAHLAAHPLRREIIATSLVNDLVDHLGPGFVYRLEERTGASTADAIRACIVVRDVFGLTDLWSSLRRQADELPSEAERLVLDDTARLLDHCAAWLIRHRLSPLDMTAEIELFKGPVEGLARTLPDSLDPTSRRDLADRCAILRAAGVSSDIAERTALLGPLAAALDIVEISRERSLEAASTSAAYFSVGARLGLRAVRTRVSEVPEDSHWTSMAKVALLDDLAAQQRRLAAAALLAAVDDAGSGSAVDRWVDVNQRTLARWSTVVADVEGSDTMRLAPAVVAIQTLREMAVPRS